MNESDSDIVKRSKGSETRVLQNLRARRDSELESCWSATGYRRIAIRYCQNSSLEQQMRDCLTKPGVIRLSPQLILLILFIDLKASTPNHYACWPEIITFGGAQSTKSSFSVCFMDRRLSYTKPRIPGSMGYFALAQEVFGYQHSRLSSIEVDGQIQHYFIGFIYLFYWSLEDHQNHIYTPILLRGIYFATRNPPSIPLGNRDLRVFFS